MRDSVQVDRENPISSLQAETKPEVKTPEVTARKRLPSVRS
jgi:hypothetical protein